MTNKKSHDYFMGVALSLARKGEGKVSPNPMVGAAVVKYGRVIGKGYHRFFGGPHAEVEALKNAGTGAKGAEMYITLEPCCHRGQTPPCTESIIAAGIKKVYVSTVDPNPLVCGRGISTLKERGVEVHSGFREMEARELNRTFFKFMETGQLFVSLKMAITADGFIADDNGEAKWITSEDARNYAHKLRASHDAVMVGIETVKRDDPSINVRLRGKYRQPLRVVIDPRLEVNPRSNLLTEKGGNVIILTSKVKGERKDFSQAVNYPKILEFRSKTIPPKEIISALSEMNVTSLLVEGGAKVFSKFISDGFVDRFYIFLAGKFFGRGLSPFVHVSGLGVRSPYEIKIENVKRFREDILIEAVPEGRKI